MNVGRLLAGGNGEVGKSNDWDGIKASIGDRCEKDPTIKFGKAVFDTYLVLAKLGRLGLRHRVLNHKQIGEMQMRAKSLLERVIIGAKFVGVPKKFRLAACSVLVLSPSAQAQTSYAPMGKPSVNQWANMTAKTTLADLTRGGYTIVAVTEYVMPNGLDVRTSYYLQHGKFAARCSESWRPAIQFQQIETCQELVEPFAEGTTPLH